MAGLPKRSGGIFGAVTKIFDKNEKEIDLLRPTVDAINKLSDSYKDLSDEEIKERAANQKKQFIDEVTKRLQKMKDPKTGDSFDWKELSTEISWSDEYHEARRAVEAKVLDEMLPEAFALVREAGARTIGLRHFDVQLLGGAVLHSGRIGEMRTGEGKTLVATLPAYLNAISGRGVHIVTVNDYLAERDANWMRPIYEFLGLKVSFLTNDMQPDQRIPAYACDILYATNSEVGFDYLRDNMAHSAEQVVQRPPNFAIVDEVDNILIDEARTPLIISAQVAKTERAMRRQELAKVVDKVARQLMPAGTDREVEILQASVTHKGRINIGGILAEIERLGSFDQATTYLIDSYLRAEKSARINNAARLLDVADELSQQKLIDQSGYDYLVHLATNAVSSDRLRATWKAQMERLAEPFAKAWTECQAVNFARPTIDQLLENILALPEESAAELPEMLEGDKMPTQVAAVIAEEMMQRAYIVPDEMDHIAKIIAEQNTDLAATRGILVNAILDSTGALQDAETLLVDSVPEDSTKVLSAEEVRTVINALEEIGRKGLLPFDVLEELWQSVQLSQDAASLRRDISQTMQGHGDASALQTRNIANKFSESRESFLKEQSNILNQKLQGYEPVITIARKGESDEILRKTLQTELSKKGPMADAAKLVRQFNKDRHQAHGQLAGHLAEEMAQWVEVPRDAKKTLTEILDDGGTQQELRERLMLAVRDYPGENSEQSALIGETLRQLQHWRLENGAALTATLTETMQLSEAGGATIREGAEVGLPSGSFEQLVNEQLLLTPQVAPLTNAVDEFSERWESHQQQQIQQTLQELGSAVELSADAQENLGVLLSAPPAKALDVAMFDALAEDSASRHLEARLNSENAVAFCDEIQRRIPLAKDVQKKLKPSEFEGRTAAQLQRSLWKLIQRSLEVMPVDDYKAFLKNLIWLSEKDERRRASSATDMGTLIAEREAGSAAFGEPENFLESLLGNDILTDEEAMLLRRAQAELPDGANATITSLVDKVLRLPAERRRHLSEAKLQEIQPILDQGIKAHALFEREVNYVIDMGDEGRREIVIVDEFTGRKMPGRRYSEGLHEALEAKHGLDVQLESQTVATITIQNYFRLYSKLAGMTGTAKTEEEEFAKTYGIEVVSIPTNNPIQRQDAPDVVYKTMEAKYRALTIDVLERHCIGKPVLVGTRSVEISESTSERLKAQPLQTLMLIQLIKLKFYNDKSIPEAEKNKILEATRGPLLQLPLASVKTLAKQAGINPDPLCEENITLLMQQFEGEDISRDRLEIALRMGLPHSVLNAKNHRNEARIVAEAARPGAVTIATNMAGRGVDIVLGGSLDIESRWRITTLQVLAKQLQGTSIAVRSRNQQTTDILLSRFNPQILQQLAWVTAVSHKVEELEKSGQLKGQAIKEIRDALGQELTAKDLVSKIRSRARRIGIEDQLPLEAKPLKDNEPADAIARDLELYTKSTFTANQIRTALQSGISFSASGRDMGETLVLQALTRPMVAARNSTGKLLEILATMPDLDRALLTAAAKSGAVRGADFDAGQIANSIGDVTIDWVASRLKALSVHDAPAAQHKLDNYNDDEVEINELQIARLLGDSNIGIQWIRERLNGWKLTKEGRAYDATPEQQQIVTDSALVHYRLNRSKAKSLWEDWKHDPIKQREMTLVEVPNLVLASDMANMVGSNDGPFMDPHWLHAQFESMGLVKNQNDFFEAQMSGQSEDERGRVQEVPITVVVYRMTLPKVLLALDATLKEALMKVGNQPDDVRKYLEHNDAWALDIMDQNWLEERLPLLDSGEVKVAASTTALIETGVSGQSADIVLEGEPRPEDIAHTSEQEQVLAMGGLQILGTERHESRRIDNQLRGRAGRQGDPGYSRFYLSLEDELWRLFGARGQWLLNKWDEDEPVEAKMISKSIENAQKKVELNHFESRKQVLQYDDVMNVQREVIYRERRRALMGEDLRDTTLDMVHQAVNAEADKNCPANLRSEEWDTHRLHLALGRLLGSSLLARHLKAEQLTNIHEREHLNQLLDEVANACFEEREKLMTPEYMRTIERWQLMRSIDAYWMEHLAEMDYLRDSIWHEGYAQRDPVGIYKHEGFELFQKTLGEIRAEVTEQVFNLQLQNNNLEDSGVRIQGMQEARITAALPADEDGLDDGVDLYKDADGDSPVQVSASPAMSFQNGGAADSPRVGRNDPCPCGSGKKYKKCCLPKEQGTLV